MKVGELIEELLKKPSDSEVFIVDTEDEKEVFDVYENNQGVIISA